MFRIVLPAETFEMVHAFAPLDAVTGFYPEGVAPYGGLTVGNDGNLYGTTNAGGQTTKRIRGCGTVFQITTAGAVTVLHSLDYVTDGCYSNAGLTLGPDGNFYGTAAYGGGNSNGASGTVFKVTPAGGFTRLFAFLSNTGCSCYPHGYQPTSEPVIDNAGNLTNGVGGPARCNPIRHGLEAVSAGELTVLKAFSGAGTGLDGYFPFTGLTMGSDGLLVRLTWAAA